MNGKRAPELASYGYTEVLSKLTDDCHMALANACRGIGLAEEEVAWQDWSLAKSHITGQLTMKLHFWSVIPWRLCGLAHQAASAASLAATAAATEQRCPRFPDASIGLLSHRSSKGR